VLYPVKSLVEDFQHNLTNDDIGHINLHVQLAEMRLEEAAALLSQERYEDVPAAMAGFEHQMRVATWEFMSIAGDDEGAGRAVALLLGKSLESHAQMLNDLAMVAPSEARSSIDHAISVLTAETATWRALLADGSHAKVSDEAVGFDLRDLRVDKRSPKSTPEPPTFSEANTGLQPFVDHISTSVAGHLFESEGILPTLPSPTQVNIPPPTATSHSQSTPIATTQPPPSETPATTYVSFPQH
jgi:hypothetical protein